MDKLSENPKTANEIRRAAFGLVRGDSLAFTQMVERYAKDYGLKVR